MSELDKMQTGELYDFSSPEIMASNLRARRCLERFNRAAADDEAARRAALEELIPGIPSSSTIVPPFFCDHGHPIRIGEGVFINAGCTFLDGGGITIGDHTLIGPGCQLLTPQHPMDYMERRRPVERGLRIEIGEDCWLGGNVTVCPGVKIGDRCIIGAGSVVVHNLPDDVLAAGNPAVVKRALR
ncbi:MAG: sugar O-acetyltransferase [Alistipes sp.]|nr:sugar O-acetyltransferase [Alistipes sp.]